MTAPYGEVNLDVRSSIETDDGAVISMQHRSRMDLGGPEGYEDYLADKFPPQCHIKTIPVLESNQPDNEWVNQVSCFGVGSVDLTANPVSIQYDVYAFRSFAH